MSKGAFYYKVQMPWDYIEKNKKKIVENMNANEKNVELNEIVNE